MKCCLKCTRRLNISKIHSWNEISPPLPTFKNYLCYPLRERINLKIWFELIQRLLSSAIVNVCKWNMLWKHQITLGSLILLLTYNMRYMKSNVFVGSGLHTASKGLIYPVALLNFESKSRQFSRLYVFLITEWFDIDRWLACAKLIGNQTTINF